MLSEEIDYECLLALEDMPLVSADHHGNNQPFFSHELCVIGRLVVGLYFN
mgnify:CR=1 FL=1|jgi:hypothetical protein